MHCRLPPGVLPDSLLACKAVWRGAQAALQQGCGRITVAGFSSSPVQAAVGAVLAPLQGRLHTLELAYEEDWPGGFKFDSCLAAVAPDSLRTLRILRPQESLPGRPAGHWAALLPQLTALTRLELSSIFCKAQLPPRWPSGNPSLRQLAARFGQQPLPAGLFSGLASLPHLTKLDLSCIADDLIASGEAAGQALGRLPLRRLLLM